ncbi:MAG: threonine synthase [Geminicoccaceae bacterium]
MPVQFVSTRGEAPAASFEEVLLSGIASDGGLYVPSTWPSIKGGVRSLTGAGFAEVAARVMAPFADGCFDDDELSQLTQAAYDTFAHPSVVPLRQLGPDDWLLELFHGPTLAFKDVAMQLLSRMFEAVLARRQTTMTILCATSGDTGAAAVGALKGRRNIHLVVLHPKGRVSEVQRRQMTTVDDDNVTNIAIEGTFDDCQKLVKAMFADREFAETYALAAVNSINWVLIAAQASYYVFSGLAIGGGVRPPAYSVPSGNFGDVYAGYVAHRMGLAIDHLIVATNRNDILARFFSSGRYAAERVHPTISPSMDIQIASNFERLLFDVFGRDGSKVAHTMERFAETRSFELGQDRLKELGELFASARIEELETLSIIA